jgi:predicted glycosyltransferase
MKEIDKEAKTVWIDLDNSPHVPFFAPIMGELEKRGFNITLTARDCFQVCGLADLHGFDYLRIGKHYGKNKVLKVGGTIYRSLQLLGSVPREKPSLALSHGSRSQVLTSRILGIQSAVIIDYEYTRGLPLIQPNVLVVPELILDGMKSRTNRIFPYPGIKEDVYVPDFVPDSKILEGLDIKESDILVTIRPPATEAHYHNPEAEVLFTEAVEFLGSREEVQMVILPRNEKKQGDLIKSRWAEWCSSGKIIIPEHVVDGLNLIWHSDLVISGGGTMNREAAALGVPVYSIFRGKIGAVDRYLSESGRLTLIEKPEDVRTKIKVVRRDKPKDGGQRDRTTLYRIVDIIEEIIRTKG